MRTGGERQEPPQPQPQPQPQPTDLPSDPPGRGGAAGSARGKHQIVADMKRLEQETRSLEEELEELEKTDRVSVACLELLQNVEGRPDPLLLVTNGPLNPSWDRWFEGPQDSQGCKCWRI